MRHAIIVSYFKFLVIDYFEPIRLFMIANPSAKICNKFKSRKVFVKMFIKMKNEELQIVNCQFFILHYCHHSFITGRTGIPT